MLARLRLYWHQLRESLWFVPGMMVLASFVLAYGLVAFDAYTNWHGEKRFPLLFGTGAEGARGMLGAIAGSMLTVATLSFSLTLSTISQVSSQYSPQVLRGFIRDRINQVVMGYFVGVFTYCLLVLGTIRGTDDIKFVPSTAVLVGLILALGGVAALIFFIHHIADSLQTGTIVQRIFNETCQAVSHLFPGQFGEPISERQEVEEAMHYVDDKYEWISVAATQSGYLQQINQDGILKWATHHHAIIRIEKEIGTFLAKGTILFCARSTVERADTNESDWADALLDYVSIGRYRNVEQDAAFGIQQLVDVALKALSPGVNDTTTAIMAVDYLGAIGEQLARRELPARLRSDGKHIRVMVKAADFEDYIRLAFDLIRINAKGNHAVFRRLFRALALVKSAVCSSDRTLAIREQADLLMSYAEQTLSTEYEKEQVRQLYKKLLNA